MLVLLAGCGAAGGRAAPKADGPPRRIVSMNPCVDAVLRDVAAPEQIAAISSYSHDPRATSVPLDWASRYPATNGSAEDAIAARPDLVIAGPHVAMQTIAALKRLGIPLMQVAVPETVAENKAQIVEIAARIGRQDAGRALNLRIDSAMLQSRWPGKAAPALIWQGSGLVPGKGTLADELLTHAGFHNVSPALGLRKWDILRLRECSSIRRACCSPDGRTWAQGMAMQTGCCRTLPCGKPDGISGSQTIHPIFFTAAAR